jgi:hypothetical protein
MGVATAQTLTLPSGVPAVYAWPTLLGRDGDDLFDRYRHVLHPMATGAPTATTS